MKLGCDTASLLDAGIARHEEGNLGEARQRYKDVLEAEPSSTEALHALGVLEYQLGRHDEALGWVRRAIEINDNVSAYYNTLGSILKELGQESAAVVSFERALFLAPDYAMAHMNLGNLLTDLRKFEEAEIRYTKAFNLLPESGQVLLNWGNMLRKAGRVEDAYALYEESLRRNPFQAEVHNNLGVLSQGQGRYGEAERCYRTAISLESQFAQAHQNLGMLLLMQERTKEGWAEFEWRLHPQLSSRSARGFSQPRWDGGVGDRVRVLIHAEQGLGDTIQFGRYVPLAAERVEVTFEVQRPLVRLMSSMSGDQKVVARGDPLPNFDFHCPLMSLPHLLGGDLSEIPAQVPYLKAEQNRVDAWKERLPGKGKFRIGIAWAGSPIGENNEGRSVHLRCFEPLARVEGVCLVSLQKNYGLDQLDQLPPGMVVERLGEDFDNGPDGFLDAAAVISSLDLVVTVDTSIAHLAGSLGCPVWIVLRTVPDWRWFTGRTGSPWYPTARLFRKGKGGWESLFADVANEVEKLKEAR